MLIPIHGRHRVKDMNIGELKFERCAGKSVARFKTRRLKDLKNTKARARRKAKKNGTV